MRKKAAAQAADSSQKITDNIAALLAATENHKFLAEALFLVILQLETQLHKRL
ncbi:MAG: hypothetical protein ACLRWM_04325 [Streptococcus sp.]